VSPLDPTRGIICLVTGGARMATRTGARGRAVEDLLVAQVSEAAAAHVDMVQVRELDLETRNLCRLLDRCLQAAAGLPTRIVVNDRADVAMATGAHGVHLRADSCAPTRVRAVVPAGFLVGRSVHHADEAADVAREGGVDYIVFGTVFASASKAPEHAVAGIEGLAAAASAARPVPVLAIGGVTVDSAAPLKAAGASGVAAIGLFLPGERRAGATLAETVRRLRMGFDTLAGLG
jgi:thiamine-phosphate pyrophosphorylase